MPVTATYAGLRPATERKEYRIRHEPDRNWLTVGGIRSTGLTAALGLARHVLELYCAAGIDHAPLDTPGLAAHAQPRRASRSRLGGARAMAGSSAIASW